MIDRDHTLTVTRQAGLLGISRGSVYYLPKPVSDADLSLMRRIDELHLEHPFMGARMLRRQLRQTGVKVGRRHVGTLMRRMGIDTLAVQLTLPLVGRVEDFQPPSKCALPGAPQKNRGTRPLFDAYLKRLSA